MTLVIEDGTGLETAESYVDTTDADTYFSTHGASATWTAATSAQKEGALRNAVAWLDANFIWPGQILNQAGPQALAWPRTWAWDREGRQLDGVPQKVKDAQCLMALEDLTTPLSTVVDGTSYIKRQKVGSVEREFQDNAPVGRQYRYVRDLLATIVGASASGAVIQLVRT